MILLLAPGAVILLAGLVAIGFGIPVQEFSFGNTLILAGTMAACTGALLVGLAVVVRELKGNVRGFGISASDAPTMVAAERQSSAEVSVRERPGTDDFPVADRPAIAPPDVETGMPPLPVRPPEVSEPAETDAQEASPAAKPRRNLLFAMSSRKERERAAASKTTEPGEEEVTAPPPAPLVSNPGARPPSFDDAWPPSPRGRADEPPPRTRTPPSFDAPNPAAGANRLQPARNADQPPVTVLKSGIVDGMAYSLYSDGSIEAQMPEGMMRFASIDELRSHLDQRP